MIYAKKKKKKKRTVASRSEIWSGSLEFMRIPLQTDI